MCTYIYFCGFCSHLSDLLHFQCVQFRGSLHFILDRFACHLLTIDAQAMYLGCRIARRLLRMMLSSWLNGIDNEVNFISKGQFALRTTWISAFVYVTQIIGM